MIIETRKVVYYRDFCQAFGVDSDQVHDALCQSDISFGNNPDTLLDCNAMEEIIAPLGHKMPEGYDDMWFSLGC